MTSPDSALNDSKVRKGTTVVIKDIYLEGVEALKATKVETTVETTYKRRSNIDRSMKLVSQNCTNQVVEALSFPLANVTPEELANYRKYKVPSFVLKVDGKLYYTQIPYNLSLLSSAIMGKHLCSLLGHECKRFSSASDEKGGCAKVRNRARYIERYPWIMDGYETFGTLHDSFVVVKCLHYEKRK